MSKVHLHTFASKTDFVCGDMDHENVRYLVQANPTGFLYPPKVLRVEADNFEALTCYVASPQVTIQDARVFARRVYPTSAYLPDSFDLWEVIDPHVRDRRLEVYAKFFGFPSYDPSRIRRALMCCVNEFQRTWHSYLWRVDPDIQANMDLGESFVPEWDVIPHPLFENLTSDQIRRLRIEWRDFRLQSPSLRTFARLQAEGDFPHTLFRDFLRITSLEFGDNRDLYLHVNFPQEVLDFFCKKP